MLINLHHEARNHKGGFRLLAVTDQAWADRRSTRLGNVPRCTRLRVVWIAHIWCSLVADGHRPDGRQPRVDKEREYWVKDTGNQHDAFYQQDEDGEDRDDEAPLGRTGTPSISHRDSTEKQRICSTYNARQGTGAWMGR